MKWQNGFSVTSWDPKGTESQALRLIIKDQLLVSKSQDPQGASKSSSRNNSYTKAMMIFFPNISKRTFIQKRR